MLDFGAIKGTFGLQVKNPECHGRIISCNTDNGIYVEPKPGDFIDLKRNLDYLLYTGDSRVSKPDHWQKIRAENPETRTIVAGKKIRL